MSGVDYSNPVVTKQDVQRVEQRIQTNTTLTQIPLASAANVLYYDATTKAVSYNTAPGGGSARSALFFNRLTTTGLWTYTLNTGTQILFLSGTEGTDWTTQVRTSVANGAGDWALNVGANTIEYRGLTGPKNFLVQVSYSITGTLSGASVAFELRRNLSGVNQLRSTLTTTSQICEFVDFNVVNLDFGQTVSLWSAASQTYNFNATNETGLAGSQTRPVQIYITEI